MHSLIIARVKALNGNLQCHIYQSKSLKLPKGANKNLFNITKCLLLDKKMPHFLWAKVVMAACTILKLWFTKFHPPKRCGPKRISNICIHNFKGLDKSLTSNLVLVYLTCKQHAYGMFSKCKAKQAIHHIQSIYTKNAIIVEELRSFVLQLLTG
jgi:hypothetical protein